MHAIAMVHKMQRLALSSSAVIPASIREDDKEEAPAGAPEPPQANGAAGGTDERPVTDPMDLSPGSL